MERLRLLPLLTGVCVLRAAFAAVSRFSTKPSDRPAETPARSGEPRRSQTGAASFALKWPNDIYAIRDGAVGKLGGILVESAILPGQAMRVVIGVGLNFRGEAPEVDGADVAPAVLLPGASVVDPLEFTPLLLEQFPVRLAQLYDSRPPPFLDEFRQFHFLKGKRVVYDTREYTVGDIRDSGALVLEPAGDTDPADRLELESTDRPLRVIA